MSQAIQKAWTDQVTTERHIPICIYPLQTDPFRLFISHFLCALFSNQMYLQLKTVFAFNVSNSKKCTFLSQINHSHFSLPSTPCVLELKLQSLKSTDYPTTFGCKRPQINTSRDFRTREHGSYPNQRYRVRWFNLWEKRDLDHVSDHGSEHRYGY